MLTEAAGLAVLAAISPTALLVAAVFLGAASPRRTILFYLAGAIAMTAVMAAVVFIVLRAGHLYKPHEHQTRYGLRLGLGVLMLLAGAYVLRRGRRHAAGQPGDAGQPADAGAGHPGASGKAGHAGSARPRGKKDKQNGGMIARLVARPGPKTAFLVGVIVYSPSLTFVAAVQSVATSNDDVASSVLALAVVIAITLVFVWGPLLLYLLMPDRTGRVLGSFNGWLRAHGHVLLMGALIVGGIVLTIDGILGLT
jgi:Sap, sulfolipid-1-addressing protein